MFVYLQSWSLRDFQSWSKSTCCSAESRRYVHRYLFLFFCLTMLQLLPPRFLRLECVSLLGTTWPLSRRWLVRRSVIVEKAFVVDLRDERWRMSQGTDSRLNEWHFLYFFRDMRCPLRGPLANHFAAQQGPVSRAEIPSEFFQWKRRVYIRCDFG